MPLEGLYYVPDLLHPPLKARELANNRATI